jgi:ubiquinone biosynthesis protein Coq4
MFRIREKCLQKLIGIAKPVYEKLCKSSKLPWKVKMEDLAAYPDQSLGKELYRFLTENNITMMERFENHDVCHVLTGYATDCVNESCMQFFLFGTGKKSIFVYGTLIISMMVLPEHWIKFFRAFKLGLKTPYFDEFNYEENLHVPLWVLQADLLRHKMPILTV